MLPLLIRATKMSPLASSFGPLQSSLTSQVSAHQYANPWLWDSITASLCRNRTPAPFPCLRNFYFSSRELSSGWVLSMRHVFVCWSSPLPCVPTIPCSSLLTLINNQRAGIYLCLQLYCKPQEGQGILSETHGVIWRKHANFKDFFCLLTHLQKQ